MAYLTRHWAPLALALICGLAAYSDSFHGPFIFDDIDAIVRNPQINQNIRDSGSEAPTTLSGRPVLRATFAADYAVGGMNVEVYHATNLLIHLAAGVVLFGIIRRNLSDQKFWGDRFIESADWLAALVTAIWLVHPLNTEAVSYVVQRAESLSGLFSLLVIYCLIRQWNIAAIVACVLGMLTKETMATVPVMALIYDRTFMTGSFSSALRKRWALYLGLAATWAIPVLYIVGGIRSSSVGNISSLDYARTQLGVIAHYFCLAIWPRNLVLDYYDWPISGIGFGGVMVLLSIVFFAAMFWLKPWLGFLGAWFFVTLAPSSSFVPIFTEIAAEHRMYLPLVAVIVLIVVGGWTLLSRSTAGAWIAGIFATVALAALSARTFVRNAEYENPELIWSDNVVQRPLNPRAAFNLGFTLESQGRWTEAADEFRVALDLSPDYYAAADALGHSLIRSKDRTAAEEFYSEEIEKFPAFAPEAHLERARLRERRGDATGAEEDFLAVTRPSEAGR